MIFLLLTVYLDYLILERCLIHNKSISAIIHLWRSIPPTNLLNLSLFSSHPFQIWSLFSFISVLKSQDEIIFLSADKIYNELGKKPRTLVWFESIEEDRDDLLLKFIDVSLFQDTLRFTREDKGARSIFVKALSLRSRGVKLLRLARLIPLILL